MDTKPWFKSRTIWTGILSGLMALYNTIAPAAGWPHAPDWITMILGAGTVYGRSTSTTNISG